MEVMIPRNFIPPESGYFLFGPRGTGKSTWLRSFYPDAFYLDLLDPDLQRRLSARPELLTELINARPHIKTYIIDEIQKVPELLGVIHRMIETDRAGQFILTGSSSRKLKRTGVNLLAGRILLKSLHPFLLSELKEHADFKKALNTGLLPLVYFSGSPVETLKAYISLYIREEVQYEALTRSIGNFSRFLEVISFSHASVLNVSNVARESQVERKVVENYITILEDILLSGRLHVFTRRAVRSTSSHPKFYFFDTGVFRAIRPRGPLDSVHEIDGQALEGLVYQHLRAWNAYHNEHYELYFWRSKSGVEVDFILYGEREIVAVEVKNSDKLRQADLRSLSEFRKDYPESKPVLLYRGQERLLRNGISCIPCEEFLRSLDMNLVPGNLSRNLF